MGKPGATASKDRRATLLALLTERRETLNSQIRRSMAERREEFQTRDAPGSHGWGAAPEGSLNLAMIQQQELLLGQIDAAIARHKAGTYGRCISCDKEIPIARLRALPFARACAACQEESEQRGGRPERWLTPGTGAG